jgi:hypothetical protein
MKEMLHESFEQRNSFLLEYFEVHEQLLHWLPFF